MTHAMVSFRSTINPDDHYIEYVKVKWIGKHLHIRLDERSDKYVKYWNVTHRHTGYSVICSSQPYREVLKIVKALDDLPDIWEVGSLGSKPSKDELRPAYEAVKTSGLVSSLK